MKELDLQALHRAFLNSSGICTDTRKLQKNSLFVALKGSNFDGNAFAEEALEAGCCLVVTERKDLEGKEGFWVCHSSLEVLQELARFHRHHVNPGVLGITGSNGKTTTKELCAAILERKFKVLATRGNLNNHIGVPLTLLALTDQEVAVVEMGANHAGEIARLAAIAHPMLGMITNVGKAHLEGFGSLEGILHAKGELYEELARSGGWAIVDGKDQLLLEKAQEVGVDVLRVEGEGDLKVEARVLREHPTLRVELKLDGACQEVETALVGAYNLQNIRLAAAVGLRMGVAAEDIAAAISSYVPRNQRSQLVEGGRNRLIMDAYNANPSSMREALRSLATFAEGPTMAILGEMAELGDESRAEHQALVKAVLGMGFDLVVLVGETFMEINEPSEFLYVFRDRQALEDWLSEEKLQGYTVLLKGSRVNELEMVKPFLV